MAQSSTQSTLAPGTVLQRRFRIEQMIGSGGYAAVYRALDMQSGQEYAIKEVVDPDPAVHKQFHIEAELLIHAPHRNIPRGFDYFDEKGRMYLVMEYVRGKDLEERLNDSLVNQGRPLDEAQVLGWMIQICDALVEMHTQPVPIIHRDIKPANIKITPDDRPVLIDFGLAKQQRMGNPTLTAAQGVSPGFAPPEQYMAKGKTDQRTDVYALGATLYACLTGKDPAEAPARLLAQTGTRSGGGAALQSPRKLNARVSEPTERLIMKSLELSPMQRQQTARSMRTELRAALATLTGVNSGAARALSGDSGKRSAVSANGSSSNPGSGARNRAPKPAGAGVAAAAAAAAGVGATGAHSAYAQSWPQGPTEGGLGRPGKQPAAAGRTAKQAAVASTVAPEPRSAKQAVAAATLAEPRTAKQAAANAARTGQHLALPSLQTPLPSSAASLGTRTAQQPALKRGTGQQPSVMDSRTHGRQAVVAPHMGAGLNAAAGFGSAGLAGGAGAVALGGTGVAVATRVSGGRQRTARSRPWIWLGDEQLTTFGKWMLLLAFVEVFWGVTILALGAIVIATPGRALPVQQLAIGWAAVVLVVCLIGGQALSRPVFRRGYQTKLRRSLQGTGLAIYTVVVHGVAIWGATIFAATQNNALLATIAFLLFGINVLVVGILSVVNALS